MYLEFLCTSYIWQDCELFNYIHLKDVVVCKISESSTEGSCMREGKIHHFVKIEQWVNVGM